MIDDPVRLRLTELAEQRGVSLAGLSRLIGRNATYLPQFLRKGSPRKLDEEDRRTLAEFFGVPESELGGAAAEPKVSHSRPREKRLQRIRCYDIRAAAGAGAFADEGTLDEDWAIAEFGFDADWLRGHDLAADRLSMIEVAGDSMEPNLSNGDLILVERHRPGAPVGEGVHVLRTGDGLLVKRLGILPGGQWRISSDNTAYPAFDVTAGSIEVIGRVVRAVRAV